LTFFSYTWTRKITAFAFDDGLCKLISFQRPYRGNGPPSNCWCYYDDLKDHKIHATKEVLGLFLAITAAAGVRGVNRHILQSLLASITTDKLYFIWFIFLLCLFCWVGVVSCSHLVDLWAGWDCVNQIQSQ
jgi:hypothetical protein